MGKKYDSKIVDELSGLHENFETKLVDAIYIAHKVMQKVQTGWGYDTPYLNMIQEKAGLDWIGASLQGKAFIPVGVFCTSIQYAKQMPSAGKVKYDRRIIQVHSGADLKPEFFDALEVHFYIFSTLNSEVAKRVHVPYSWFKGDVSAIGKEVRQRLRDANFMMMSEANVLASEIAELDEQMKVKLHKLQQLHKYHKD